MRKRHKAGQYGRKCCNPKHFEWLRTNPEDVEVETFCPKFVVDYFISLGARKKQKFCKACQIRAKAQINATTQVSNEVNEPSSSDPAAAASAAASDQPSTSNVADTSVAAPDHGEEQQIPAASTESQSPSHAFHHPIDLQVSNEPSSSDPAAASAAASDQPSTSSVADTSVAAPDHGEEQQIPAASTESHAPSHAFHHPIDLQVSNEPSSSDPAAASAAASDQPSTSSVADTSVAAPDHGEEQQIPAASTESHAFHHPVDLQVPAEPSTPADTMHVFAAAPNDDEDGKEEEEHNFLAASIIEIPKFHHPITQQPNQSTSVRMQRFHLPAPDFHLPKPTTVQEPTYTACSFNIPDQPSCTNNVPVPDGPSRLPANWMLTTFPGYWFYFLLKQYPGQDPVIYKSLTVLENGPSVFRIYGNVVDPPTPFVADDLDHLLQHLDTLPVCPGITEESHLQLAEKKGGRLGNASLYDQIVENSIGQKFNKTIRHDKCSYLQDKGDHCSNCDEYKPSLRTMLWRAQNITVGMKEARVRVDSKTALHLLQPEELLERSRRLAKENKNSKLKIARLLERVLKREVESEGIDVGDGDVAEGLKELMISKKKDIADHFQENTFGQLFWKQQQKALETEDPRGYRWHPMMIKWCLNLKMASSKAYEIIRNSGIIKLPNKTTLQSYVHWTKPTSGFTVDALKQLCKEINLKDRTPHQRYVIIVHDEMKVKSDLVYNKSTGRLVGFTKLDNFEQELRSYESNLQEESTAPEEELAHHVLVFQVRALFWKFHFPLAHFPTTNTKGYEIFSLFWKAVEILELAGFKVVGVTCDGASTNRKFFDMHGESSVTKPIFRALNPYADDYAREIFLINDPPHLIKCARNAWENKKRMLWNHGNITWKLVEDLYYNDVEMDGLYLNKKLKYENVQLTSFSKMKVGLAAQVLSASVSNALELFHGPSALPAAKFAEILNKYFDLLNVRSLDEAVKTKNLNKLPYENLDDPRFQWLQEEFINFLEGWDKAVEERPGVYTRLQRDKMKIPSETLIALRRTALGFPAMAQFLLQQPGVKYILSEKMNQDKLESSFGNIRQMKGGNEAPTVTQVNSQMNVARLKSSQELKVLRGNTYDKTSVQSLAIDDTPLSRRPTKKQKADTPPSLSSS